MLDDQAAVQYVESVEPGYLQSYLKMKAVERPAWSQEQLLEAFATVMKGDLWCLLDHLVRNFKKFIWPYLTDAEIQTMRDQLRLVLNSNQQWDQEWHQVYYLVAAYLGMHNEVLRQVESWQSTPNLSDWRTSQLIEIVFSLGDPQLVNIHTRRLNLNVANSKYTRGWLAHTEYSALDWVCSSMLKYSYI